MKTSICLILFVLLLSVEASAEKIPEQSSIQIESYSVENFKDNKKEAEKWHKNELKEWTREKRISREEQQIISKIKKTELTQLDNYTDFFEDFLKNKLNINDALRQSGGRIDRIFDSEELKPLKKWIKEESDNYDNLFREKGKELKEDLVVHSTISLSLYSDIDTALGETMFRDMSNPAFINKDAFQFLESSVSWGQMMYYGVFDLTQVGVDQEGIIKLELTVPRGTKVLFNEKKQVILPRNQGIQIQKKPTIINRYGKEFVLLEARMGDISEVEKEEKEQESKVTERFDESKLFETLPRESGRIKLDLTGKLASIYIPQIKDALDSVLKNFDGTLLRKLIKYMDLKEGTITFTDNPIAFTKGFQTEGPEDETKESFDFYVATSGLTSYGGDMGTRIIICTNKSRHTDSIEGILTHELGHVAEILLMKRDHVDKTSFSEVFKQIFKEESTTLPDKAYGKKNEKEYWAETFRELYATDSSVKEFTRKQRPKTYKFITEQIEFIKKYL